MAKATKVIILLKEINKTYEPKAFDDYIGPKFDVNIAIIKTGNLCFLLG